MMAGREAERGTIQAGTHFVLVVGDPISHSISPRLHNTCFQREKRAVLYLPIRIERQEVRALIRELRSSLVLGLNVTLPLKEECLAAVDTLDPDAAKIGAVNVIAFRKGQVHGFNTDASAFGEALSACAHFEPHGKRMLILGAGGAARACIFEMCRRGISEITVCNRHRPKAANMIRKMRQWFPSVYFRNCDFSRQEISRYIGGAGLVINATSWSRSVLPTRRGHACRGPVDWQRVASQTIFFDLGYEKHTALERWALAEHGSTKGRFYDGLEMLVRQAAASYSIWTGARPPLRMMRQVVRRLR